MEGKNLELILQENTWLPKKEKTSTTLAQEGIITEKTLGEGAYAKVKSAYYEKLKKKVAVKIINKLKAPKEFMEKFLKREIAMMSELDHPNIIQLLAVFESEDKIFLVMELADGGDLLDHVNNQKYTSDEEIRKHFLQLSSAMAYSHQMGVVHRDLKLENIVLDKDSNLKITDYGFARLSAVGNKMETFCGSFAYASPTILRGEAYDGFTSDVWSMGIMLYTMFTYKLPYTDVDLKLLAKGNGCKKLKFTKDTPHAARDLLRRMLDPVDETRITCQQILSHDWLRGQDVNIDSNVKRNAPTAEFKQMANETSGSSITASAMSVRGPIPRNNQAHDVIEHENEQEEEKQFRLITARRSTVTSIDNQRILSNVISPKKTNFVDTVKKKRVALMCLGGLGKKKKDKAIEETAKISGTIKYKESKKDRKMSKKGSNLGDVVTQIMKSQNENKDNINEDEETSDDESIQQMRRELDCISQEDSSQAVTIKKEKSRKASLVQQIKPVGRSSKWKKVVGRIK